MPDQGAAGRLALAGTAVIQNDAAAIIGLCFILGGVLLKIRQEEHLLSAHFGPTYAAYRTAVPSLLPRFWRRSSLSTP